MAGFRCIFALVCGALAHVNEATVVHEVSMSKVLSKQEIMANMTADLAMRTILGMSRTQEHPEFVELLRNHFGQVSSHRHVSLIALGSKLRGSAEPNALVKATNMLNSMIEETQGGLEAERDSCRTFDLKTTRALESMRTAVSNFNAAAAAARGDVIRAQGQIGTVTSNLVQAGEDFERHKLECVQEIAEFNRQLTIVEADIEVMAKILEYTDCNGAAATSKLIQCSHCDDKFMVTHGPVQQMLGKLRSRIARQFVQKSLEVSYHDSLNGSQPVALAQDDVKLLRGLSHLSQKEECVDLTGRYMFSPGGNDGNAVTLTQTGCSGQATGPDIWTYTIAGSTATINGRGVTGEVSQANGVVTTISWSNGIVYTQFSKLPDVPTAPQQFDCQPTNKCSLSSSPNCAKLKDRFLMVQAEIVDSRDDLASMLAAKQTYCEQTSTQYTHQIDGMNTQLRREQAALAVGTEEQNQAETGSHQKSQQHASTSTEYSSTLAKCCENKNTAKSEICALEKIRGELLKLDGQSIYMVDCDVSEWREEECSVTCGGGSMRKSRSIIVQPQGGGTKCPLLEATDSCNEDPCPVDCRVDDWSGWSDCSAECGGGVIERSRTIEVQPAHGGEPCEETEDEAACNIQSCDTDCVLSEWSDWGACSKACGRGSQSRTKSIAIPAQGQGHCAEPMDGSRLGFKRCSTQSCRSIVPRGRTVLNCDSMVDVVIVVDGSGSLGQQGWDWSMQATGKLIAAFNNGSSNVQVALQIFSGPSTWTAYQKCIGNTGGAVAVDMQHDCGITWVTHLTSDQTTLKSLETNLATTVDWPSSTTMTSAALGQADSELVRGRQEANSVVVVLTDGYPLSKQSTKAAADKLSAKAKVLWVPVGGRAPLDRIQEMAQEPKEEHIIKSTYFQSLSSPWVLNQIISDACPLVS